MQKFYDVTGDTVEVAEKVDKDNELYIGTSNTTLYLDPETSKEIAVAIYKAAGGNDEAPVMATTISFNEGVIRLAAIHGKTVEFRYVKSSAHAPETRRFVPSSVRGSGDTLAFVGKDPDRDNDYRSFRLDRIKGTVAVIA